MQLVKDMISVSEATNWNVRGSVESKYRAMSCQIEHLAPGDPEFQAIYDKIIQSQIGSVIFQN